PARAPAARSLAAPAGDVAPPGGGEDAAPRAGRGGERDGDRGRAARGCGRQSGALPARGSARQRARLLRPLPREDALAEPAGGLLPLSERLARVEARRRGRPPRGGHDRRDRAHAPPSLPARAPHRPRLHTWRQLGYWHDSTRLFTHALEVTRANWLAPNNLGDALAREGKLEDATGHFAESVRLEPSNPDAHYNLGVALHRQ